MQCILLLDVVVAERFGVFQLLTRKVQALLLWRDAFLGLDLAFEVGNRVAGLNVIFDGLVPQVLDEDLNGGLLMAGIPKTHQKQQS